MRPQLALATLALLTACSDPPEPKTPDSPPTAREEALAARARRAEAEAQEARRQANDVQAQREAEETIRAAALRDATLADQRRRQAAERARSTEEQARLEQERTDWLMHGLSWQSSEAKAVATVWYAYAKRARSDRSHEALWDAFGEARTATRQEPEAMALAARFMRRAWTEWLTQGEGGATGDESRVFVPHFEWDQCLADAPKTKPKARQAMHTMEFLEMACFKTKRSIVTGNIVIDDERHWPL